MAFGKGDPIAHNGMLYNKWGLLPLWFPLKIHHRMHIFHFQSPQETQRNYLNRIFLALRFNPFSGTISDFIWWIPFWWISLLSFFYEQNKRIWHTSPSTLRSAQTHTHTTHSIETRMHENWDLRRHQSETDTNNHNAYQVTEIFLHVHIERNGKGCDNARHDTDDGNDDVGGNSQNSIIKLRSKGYNNRIYYFHEKRLDEATEQWQR